jgi:hypothetical protein
MRVSFLALLDSQNGPHSIRVVFTLRRTDPAQLFGGKMDVIELEIRGKSAQAALNCPRRAGVRLN